MFVSGGVIAILLGLSGANWTLVFILIALAGFGFGGQQLVLNYLIAEAYPTQLRATATVWSIGIGRLGSIVGSALGGVLLTGLGISGHFMSLAVPLALAAVATLMVRHHRAGTSLRLPQRPSLIGSDRATDQRNSPPTAAVLRLLLSAAVGWGEPC